MICKKELYFRTSFFEKHMNNDKRNARDNSLLTVFKVCYNIYIYY